MEVNKERKNKKLMNNLSSSELLKTLGLTNIAGIAQDNLIVSYGGENDKFIHIDVSMKLEARYCPLCNSRLYSKGPVPRSVRHPVLHNGKIIIVNLKQRKYRCTNEQCNYYYNEEFGFVDKYKHISTTVPYLIMNDLKDITLTCAAVSRRYQVSDTYVHDIMMRYVDFKPLPLPKVISIDEVYLNIDYDSRYVVLITDFITGDIIDVLPNRYDKTIKDFFSYYSLDERKQVEYVISDMYGPYLDLPKKYLPASDSVIDSFHIIQIIEKAIRKYLNDVKKRYQRKLNEERKENNLQTNKNYKTRKDSVELTLLKNHDWVLLCKPGNEPDIDSRHYSRRLGMYPTVERIQKAFLELDPHFESLKELKDMYLAFNDEYVGSPDKAGEALKELIEKYRSSDYQIFKEFAELLEKHFFKIINSFNLVKITGVNKDVDTYRRLSNGPLEGLNRKPQDMKRMARGFTNFDFVRNRLLWSLRKDAALLAVPKPKATQRNENK